jgi:hypothetical protein
MKATIEEIYDDVKSLRRSVVINRGIYIIIGITVLGLVFQSFRGQGQMNTNFTLATESFKIAVEAKADQASVQNQLIDYIDRMTQAMDKLQKDNQGVIKVPVAPVPRPRGLPPPTDKELDRPVSAVPIPTPTPNVKVIKVPGPVRYRTPPSFWDKILKKTPTPRPKRR